MCAATIFPWTRVRTRTLSNVIATVGTDLATVMVYGPEIIGSALDIPENVTLWFVNRGGLYLKADINIHGPIVAPCRQIFAGDGQVYFRGGSSREVWADWWVTSRGGDDDAPAIAAMARSIPNGARAVFRFTPGKTYRLRSTAMFQLQNHHSVEASGAHFRIDTPGIVGIDINPRANPEYTDKTVTIFSRWTGGSFFTKQKETTALRAFCFRNLNLQDVHIEGFTKGIEWSAKDTIRFKRFHFRKNYIGAFLAKWATDDTVTIDTVFEDCHFVVGGMAAGIFVEGPWTNFAVRGGSFNGGGDLTSILMSNKGFHGMEKNSRGFLVEGVHFEQGTDKTRYVWIHDSENKATHAVHIRGNLFGYGEPTALKLERVRGARIEANSFAQGAGTSYEIDDNCSGITIDRSNYFTRRGTTIYPLTLTPNGESRVTFTGGGKGGNITSANRIALSDPFSTAFVIEGNEEISEIAASWPGRLVTLRFRGEAAVRDGGNIKLSDEFTGVADRQLTLVCENGRVWREVSRSYN